MSLFGAIVRTAVNLVKLPVAVVADVTLALPDAARNDPVGHRTARAVQELKDEAEDDERAD